VSEFEKVRLVGVGCPPHVPAEEVDLFVVENFEKRFVHRLTILGVYKLKCIK
jgi:hypothetical protein